MEEGNGLSIPVLMFPWWGRNQTNGPMGPKICAQISHARYEHNHLRSGLPWIVPQVI
jgi:hypothetical protein